MFKEQRIIDGLIRNLREAEENHETTQADWEAGTCAIRDAARALFPDGENRANDPHLAVIGSFPGSIGLKRMQQLLEAEKTNIANLRARLKDEYNIDV